MELDHGRRTMFAILSSAFLLAGFAAHLYAEEGAITIFDFEGDTNEWAIPEWADESPDYFGSDLGTSTEQASSGESSLTLMADFSGKKWSGAYVENLMRVTDWSQFGTVQADIYLPYNAPADLQARFILTVGKDWKWTEMNRGIPLEPDQWTTITVNIKPGSQDWKFFIDDSFRKDIRKLGIRVESERTAYKGPIYIDNIRLLP